MYSKESQFPETCLRVAAKNIIANLILNGKNVKNTILFQIGNKTKLSGNCFKANGKARKNNMYKDGEKGNTMSVFIKTKRVYKVYGCISGMLRFLDSQM